MLSLRKVVVGSSLFSVAILLAACNSSGGGSSKPQPSSGSANLHVDIQHSGVTQARALLGANYKADDGAPEQITVKSGNTVLDTKNLPGPAGKEEQFDETNIKAGTYTITANTYSYSSGNGATTITCTPDQASRTIELASHGTKTDNINYTCTQQTAKQDKVTVRM